MKQPELHPEADLEIGDALVYYSETPRDVFDRFEAKVELALSDIAEHPDRYPQWEPTDVRRYVITEFPFVLFYLHNPHNVRVLAFAHTSRRPGYWKSRIAG